MTPAELDRKAAAVLRAAATEIQTYGHAKHTIGTARQPKCLSGAAAWALGSHPTQMLAHRLSLNEVGICDMIMRRAMEAVERYKGLPPHSVIQWNDSISTTQEDVIDACLGAAAQLDATALAHV